MSVPRADLSRMKTTAAVHAGQSEIIRLDPQETARARLPGSAVNRREVRARRQGPAVAFLIEVEEEGHDMSDF